MKNSATLIVHPGDKNKLEALISFLSAFKIKFETVSNDVDTFTLSEQQKAILDSRRKKAKKEDFFSVEEVNLKLKKKYGI